jgi:hypothetical protein
VHFFTPQPPSSFLISWYFVALFTPLSAPISCYFASTLTPTLTSNPIAPQADADGATDNEI